MSGTVADTVNLDALIVREYFESSSLEGRPIPAAQAWREIGINTLTPDDRLSVLRKPVFQRETSAWRPDTVSVFIKSVVDNDVVPAVILWRSSKTGHTFVIDGAHRLSALAAWVNDDYGDGDLSRAFYGDTISQQQVDIARRTRELVEAEVGPYAKLAHYNKNPSAAPTAVVRARATSIFQTVNVQPITGDANAAEQSYIRINSTAAPITKTELTLIQSRDMPAGLATRALMHAGEGFEYWGRFEDGIRDQIKDTSARIYSQLIKPINDYPVLALDLPAPKRGYSANSMQTILDLVVIVNRQPDGKGKKPTPDADGTKTVQHLERVREATERVFGSTHPGSLALHPALYCYDSRGKFLGKALIGAIEFVRYLKQTDKFFSFTKHRKAFEDFLVTHPHLMNQIGETQGSGGSRGVSAVVDLYKALLSGLESGLEPSGIINEIRGNPALKFLEWAPPEEKDGGRKFSGATKAAAVIKFALEKDICPECHGRFYIKDRSHDHKIRKEDGGKSVVSNIELKHPYCNTGYKERVVHLAKGKANAQAKAK